METIEFFPAMQAVYDRLAKLAKTEIWTEEKKIEEMELSATFWDMRRLNDFLRVGPCYHSSTYKETYESDIKRRIIHLAHYQSI